jgi:hypothetical protein
VDTALERLEGRYLYSINLHAHVLGETDKLVKLVQAANQEGGWLNARSILCQELGDGLCIKPDEMPVYELRVARDHMTKKLKKAQAEYQKLSGKISGLLDDSDRLRVKVDRLVASP